MNIDPNDPRLTAYVLGELDQKEQAEIEARLEKSEELRQAVREIRETTELLTREFQDEPCQALSDDQRRAVEAAAAKANGVRGPQNNRRSILRRVLVPLSLAASVLFVAGVVVPMFFPVRQASRRATAPAGEHLVFSQAPSGGIDLHGRLAIPSASRPQPHRGAKAKTAGSDALVFQLDGVAGNVFVATDSFHFKDSSLVDKEARKGERLYAYAPGDGVVRALKFTQYGKTGPGQGKPGSRFYGFGGVSVQPDTSSNTEAYDQIVENPFLLATQNPLSTFSIDVDTASYANIRRFLTQGSLPPRGAVRIEEMVNYFEYCYPLPTGEAPFSVNVEVADCPWTPGHRLARIGLKGYEVNVEDRPVANLVFLLDVSGSMNSPAKLPLLKQAMRMLTTELADDDRVAIAVYAGASGVVLPSTLCEDRQTILGALNRLQAGGSTNGGAGIQLAYDLATDNFIEGGVNRVILATDGDFNVGVTDQGDLISLIEEKAKSGVFLSVLGFGTGNLKDSTMEKLADKGNGNYSYIDTLSEARKVLVEQMGGTLVTIAKDVKIQIEFNPAEVGAYRLIGYENRMLRKEDFNNDTIDAGEIGAGHTVTAFYEIVPAGEELDSPTVDPLKYQTPPETDANYESGELFTVKLRYKEPDGDTSRLLEVPVTDAGLSLADASDDFAFGAAVASFGMLLRGSEHCGEFTYGAVLEMADAALGEDPHGYRQQFVDLVHRAIELQPAP